MFDPLPKLLPPPPPAPAPLTRRRSRPFIAWVVILVLVALIPVVQVVRPRTRGERMDRLDVELMRSEGRRAVGMTVLPGASRAEIYEQTRALNTGPVERRLRFIVLAGELA